MFIFRLALLSLLASSAWSNQEEVPPNEPQEQIQGQIQGQEQAQDTQQSQTQSATGGEGGAGGGGDATLTEGDVLVLTKQRKSTPTVYAPSINPTSPCIVTGGLGVSFPGGGGSIGGGKLDKGCEARETARLFAEMGAPDIGFAILCKSKAVGRTIGEEACKTRGILRTIGYTPPAPVPRQKKTELTVTCTSPTPEDRCYK